ncbi:MAG: hypothetical protein R3208_20395 [Ketobacteraceae bacterium]|nr:hypothetical protein [Ketobacteraceae bacterium]
MIFRLLLWVLGWRINTLAKKHPGFQRAIGDYRVVLQFRTRDGRAQRYYVFDAGDTCSRPGVHEDPTIAFVFNNPKQAMSLIKRMGEHPEDKTIFIMAIKEGLLSIEGDMAYLTWFQAISRYFGPQEKPRANTRRKPATVSAK